MEQLILSLEVPRANRSQLQQERIERAWMESLISCSSISELYAKFAQRGFCGRTSPVFSTLEIMRSPNYSKSYLTSGMVLHGQCLMLNSSTWRNGASVCFLSDVLEGGGSAAAVLFDSESVSGNTQSPQSKRQEIARANGKSANPAIQVMTNTTCNAAIDVDMSGTLLAGGGEPPIVIVPKAYTLKMRGGKDTYIKRDGTKGTAGKGALVGDDCAFTLSCTQDQTLFAYDEIAKDYVARNFTPREEERLQGFPDDWTKVPYRGKSAEDCPDAPRYKAIGNSMAVPVMRWLGERIALVDELQKEIQKISE